MENLPAGFGLFCGGFFFLLMLGVGVALLVSSERSQKKAGASQSWPSVLGVISSSDVAESASRDDDGHPRHFYYPRIVYSYAVAGKTYTCQKISFGGVIGTGSAQPARAVTARYPVAAPVTVFYNPEDPADAVLERTLSKGGKAMKIAGIILIILSVISACPLLIGVINAF